MLDQETRDVFEETSHSDAFSNIGYEVGRPYVVAGGIGVLYLTGLTTKNTRLKAATYDLANGYLLETGIVMALKYAVGRKRPDITDRLSFPSGHAGSAVLAATILNYHYGLKVGIPAYLAATYIGASRLKKDSHYLSDVIAGASIGYLVGKTITRRRQVQEQKLLWMPTIMTLPGRGVNLQLTLIF
jgi:membrane-associated phospholipid phosphatase